MNWSQLLSMLPYILKGMLGIFVVILIIMLAIYLLNVLTNKKKEQ